MDARTATGATTKSSRPLIAALLIAFVAGALLAGYAVYRWSLHQRPALAVAASHDPDAAAPTNAPAATPSASAAAQAVMAVQAQHGGIDQRLAAAEQRLARLDLQAQAVSGNTARAEGLLIAFAARRTLDKGAPLGYLGDQLKLRFGGAQPDAVRTILAAGDNPVTRDQLLARLEGLAPQLAEDDALPVWGRFQNELSQLFVIRRQSAPSPQPQRRLERARLFLEAGRTDAAIAEVRNLPGAGGAKGWLADARRYAAVQDALDLIETAAVSEPRDLRGGDGARVEQPGPAAAN